MDVRITQKCLSCEGEGKLHLTKEIRSGKIPDGEEIITCPVCEGAKYSSFVITKVIKCERIYDTKDYALDT
jgi:excinuclease UvrABC ATPase subunit